MCRLGWGRLWNSPGCSGGPKPQRPVAAQLSARRSVPPGRGRPSPEHTGCGPFCVPVGYEQMRLWAARKGSPAAWRSHSVVSRF